MAENLAQVRRILRELVEQLPEDTDYVDFDLGFGRPLQTPIEPHDQILDMRLGTAIRVPGDIDADRLRNKPARPAPKPPRKRGWKRPDKVRPPLDQERALLFGSG
jgi:hypothetical protein